MAMKLESHYCHISCEYSQCTLLADILLSNTICIFLHMRRDMPGKSNIVYGMECVTDDIGLLLSWISRILSVCTRNTLAPHFRPVLCCASIVQTHSNSWNVTHILVVGCWLLVTGVSVHLHSEVTKNKQINTKNAQQIWHDAGEARLL